MKWKTFVIGYALALGILLFAQRHARGTPSSGFTAVLDLTHVVSSNLSTYELEPKSFTPRRTAATLEKLGYAAHEIGAPERLETHIDSPAHFAPGLWTVNKIPVERLVAPLAVLDVRAQVEKNPDYQVSIDDIAAWEKANSQIPQAAVVVARTGWESRWNSPNAYRNADAKGIMHFPGYSAEAARFLVEGRNTIGLGIDTLSIDNGPSKDFPVHKYTLSHSLYHLENVANLGPVPEAGAMVLVAPMKLEGGSGGPVRILALAK
jgi:kynurenine formamidase